MRDSQSLFDQLLAYGQARVLAADVHRLLGTAPTAEMTLADLVIDRASVDNATELVAVCRRPRRP
jgi:DNA polymerase-3 subunit gamma/tau